MHENFYQVFLFLYFLLLDGSFIDIFDESLVKLGKLIEQVYLSVGNLVEFKEGKNFVGES